VEGAADVRGQPFTAIRRECGMTMWPCRPARVPAGHPGSHRWNGGWNSMAQSIFPILIGLATLAAVLVMNLVLDRS
jgi:hypothetical protein